MAVYITSDLHWSHKNLCRGTCSWEDKSGCRDFDTIDKMNDWAIDKINAKVGPEDVLWNLGDVVFGKKTDLYEFMGRLKCKEMHLLRGNHEQYLEGFPELKTCFASIDNYKEIRYNKTLFCLFHYPLQVWNEHHKGAIMCHGHCHQSLPVSKRRIFDVGIDHPDSPFSLDELLLLASKRKIEVLDHHS